MVSDSIEIMHITVIEHTISQIYCVYKDMDVKMAVIFMDRKDNLVLSICTKKSEERAFQVLCKQKN